MNNLLRWAIAPLRSAFYVIVRAKMNGEVQSHVGSEATPSRYLKSFQSIFMCVQRRQDLLPTQRDTEWASKDREKVWEHRSKRATCQQTAAVCTFFFSTHPCVVLKVPYRMLYSVNILTCSSLTFFSELWEFHNIKTGGYSRIFSPLMSSYALKKQPYGRNLLKFVFMCHIQICGTSTKGKEG